MENNEVPKIDLEYSARKQDLAMVRQQALEFAAKAEEARVMAHRIEGAIQQLQALGAKEPAPPVEQESVVEPS